jgi:hypothetical protein
MTTAAATPLESWRPPATRTALVALGVGLAFLAVCAIAGFLYPQPFFQAYLFAY